VRRDSRINTELDTLHGLFGRGRFTANSYWSAAIRRMPGPYEITETRERFDRLVLSGALESVPGPRGGKGYRLTDHAAAAATRRAKAARQREARSRAELQRQLAQERQAKIRAAIRTLRDAGYSVSPPAADVKL
jgi:hypothetical protein